MKVTCIDKLPSLSLSNYDHRQLAHMQPETHNNHQSNTPWDTLWFNANLATMEGDTPYGLIQDAAVGIKDGVIQWVGRTVDLDDHERNQCQNTLDCAGKLVTPGLIDCHTHLVYAGTRADEFEQRLSGASYADIAKKGGGIMSTVKATRAASEQTLLDESCPRLHALMSEGVTTIEIKSGYGLDRDNELKMLRVIKTLSQQNPIEIHSTCLGAHAVPPQYQGNADGYVDWVVNHLLPEVAQSRLATAVDAFCEGIGFSLDQTQRVLTAALDLGFQLKCHAEQLSNLGGAAMAGKLGALSVDHLEYLVPEDIAHLKSRPTTAVVLPGAFYFLRETQLPPIDALRDAGIPIAIATDCNPGSSPTQSLLLMLNMACTFFALTPEEALSGVTKHAAHALGIESTHGTLRPGKVANMVQWTVRHPAELSYQIAANPCERVLFQGQLR